MSGRLRVASLLIGAGLIGAGLLGAGLLAGCSAGSDHRVVAAVDDAAPPVAAGDPAYALTALHDGPEGDDGVLPETLAEALPNHRIVLQGKTQKHTARLSRALVVGRVLQVVKGHGAIWHEDESFERTDFDDSGADTRNVLVTMTADEVAGVRDGARTMTFRVLVPPETDPQRFAEGLAGLDRIAVLLDLDPSRVDSTPWRPIIDDRMILVVAADGALSMPTVHHARAFEGDIHTVDDLLAAARGPVTTSTRDARGLLP